MPDKSDLPQGTLDLLILQVVAGGAWKISDTGRESKFYRLTPKGRKRLKEEAASWLRLTEAVGLILKTTGGSR